MKKQKTPLEYYTLFLCKFQTMNETPFKTTSLKRILQPYCNFYHLSENCFNFKIKGSKLGLRCQIIDNYIIIKKQFHIIKFEFSLSTTKNFLQKLIKHDLLRPTLFINYSDLTKHKL